jgi:hypothetical protein
VKMRLPWLGCRLLLAQLTAYPQLKVTTRRLRTPSIPTRSDSTSALDYSTSFYSAVRILSKLLSLQSAHKIASEDAKPEEICDGHASEKNVELNTEREGWRLAENAEKLVQEDCVGD